MLRRGGRNLMHDSPPADAADGDNSQGVLSVAVQRSSVPIGITSDYRIEDLKVFDTPKNFFSKIDQLIAFGLTDKQLTKLLGRKVSYKYLYNMSRIRQACPNALLLGLNRDWAGKLKKKPQTIATLLLYLNVDLFLALLRQYTNRDQVFNIKIEGHGSKEYALFYNFVRIVRCMKRASANESSIYGMVDANNGMDYISKLVELFTQILRLYKNYVLTKYLLPRLVNTSVSCEKQILYYLLTTPPLMECLIIRIKALNVGVVKLTNQLNRFLRNDVLDMFQREASNCLLSKDMNSVQLDFLKSELSKIMASLNIISRHITGTEQLNEQNARVRRLTGFLSGELPPAMTTKVDDLIAAEEQIAAQIRNRVASAASGEEMPVVEARQVPRPNADYQPSQLWLMPMLNGQYPVVSGLSGRVDHMLTGVWGALPGSVYFPVRRDVFVQPTACVPRRYHRGARIQPAAAAVSTSAVASPDSSAQSGRAASLTALQTLCVVASGVKRSRECGSRVDLNSTPQARPRGNTYSVG